MYSPAFAILSVIKTLFFRISFEKSTSEKATLSIFKSGSYKITVPAELAEAT